MHVSNTQNPDLYYLSIYSNQSLINGWQIYHVNDDIVERLNYGFIVDLYTQWIQEE